MINVMILYIIISKPSRLLQKFPSQLLTSYFQSQLIKFPPSQLILNQLVDFRILKSTFDFGIPNCIKPDSKVS